MLRALITATVVLVALAIAGYRYRHYLENPWTRDGQVRAQVIQITPRVSGPIVALPIRDNQQVKTGDLLFQIDPRTFQSALDEAKATLQLKRVALSNKGADADRYRNAAKQSPGAVSAETVAMAVDSERGAAAEVAQQQAAVESSRLDLEFTRVTAPVAGYVTNLNLRLGSQAVVNQPALALVDSNSFWIHGFFKETVVADMREGDRAIVTLMSYPDRPLEGRVDSLGWGIAQSDGSAGENLLPNISPTFEWIRLAQRVPVRVHLVDLPDDVHLRVGTTASVLVMTGTRASAAPVPAVPAAAQ